MAKMGQTIHSFTEEFKLMAVKKYEKGKGSYKTIPKRNDLDLVLTTINELARKRDVHGTILH
jgi:transposase-like protein